MYGYEWDAETGGILLNTDTIAFSKEPRPVYYKELDILGFDKYWKYEKSDKYPYMWAEANKYIYKGKLVAKTVGGSLHNKPEIEILSEPEDNNSALEFVDIKLMVEKNRELMTAIINETLKKVYHVYNEYKNKVDLFYVAFSGGKDSVVLLDIVRKALPSNEFIVLFGDTMMEFCDTYDVVDKTRIDCEKNGIKFIQAKSHMTPSESWNIFGPPASTIRWCCSVHKTAPQILAIRKYLNKNNFSGMAFVGVRAAESLRRSKYEYIGKEMKHKGQYSCNVILDWTSSLIYLYMYENNLIINDCYKKGNNRAGCLVCPGASKKNEFMNNICYKDSSEKYINKIIDLYNINKKPEEKKIFFFEHEQWKARKNGRDLNLYSNINEYYDEEKNYVIDIDNAKTDWKIWIKTIGILVNNSNPYKVKNDKNEIEFQVEYKDKNSYKVVIPSDSLKSNAIFGKLLKNVFHKSASCIGCRECEADCPYGNISFANNQLRISNDCIHCSKCHKVPHGCLVYYSTKKNREGLKMKNDKKLNRYSHHSPKREWFNEFFEYKNDFNKKNSLGSQMLPNFKRFLRDTNLLEDNKFSYTAELVDKIGLNNNDAWALMLVNLCYSSQINWYVKNVKFGDNLKKDYLVSLLQDNGEKDSWAKDIVNSLKRIIDLPFGRVGLGSTIYNKRFLTGIVRNSNYVVNSLVLLYALYKFSEACGQKEELKKIQKEYSNKKLTENSVEYLKSIKKLTHFSLFRLYEEDIEREGVSPAEIFNIDKDYFEKALNGLSSKYSDYIYCSFTLGLGNIILKDNYTSNDILILIGEEYGL